MILLRRLIRLLRLKMKFRGDWGRTVLNWFVVREDGEDSLFCIQCRKNCLGKFCSECGEVLEEEPRCPQCDTRLTEWTKFCPASGVEHDIPRSKQEVGEAEKLLTTPTKGQSLTKSLFPLSKN